MSETIQVGEKRQSLPVQVPKTEIDISPSNDPSETRNKPVSLLSLFRFATPFEIALNGIGFICAAAAGAAQPLISLLFGNLTSAFVHYGAASVKARSDFPSHDVGSMLAASDQFKSVASRNTWLLVVLGLAQGVATWVYMYIWSYTAEKNAKRVREQYLTSVLRQDVAFFDDIGAGEIATRIQTDTHLVQEAVSEKMAMVVRLASSFVAGFVFAFIRSWKLALAMSSIVPVIFVTGFVMSTFEARWTQQSQGHVAVGGTLAEEAISTIRTAHAVGAQETLSQIYERHINNAMKVERKASIAVALGTAVFLFTIYGSYGLGFFYGTKLVLDGDADVGIIINVLFAILIGSFSSALLPANLEIVSHGRAAATKLFSTIDRVPVIDSFSQTGLKPAENTVKGHVSFENVTFSYPSRPTVPVISGLNLDFEAGKTTAIVGLSGSGKSTIISLTERFYDPSYGSVKLDLVDIRDLNVTWLRSQIGLVSQEPTLFATTIWENVAHGLIRSRHGNMSREEKDHLIKQACRQANAHDFVALLPNGYSTVVGERGFLLSGGQKQRVAIARAIVSNPKILLLDEATSALDTRSEKVVQNALERASVGRTTIVIAHRLSTIKSADKICVMGEGKVLEMGTHVDLLSDSNGPYAKLVAAQKLRDVEESYEGVLQDEKRQIFQQQQVNRGLPVVLEKGGYTPSTTTDIAEKAEIEIATSNIVQKQKYSTANILERLVKLNRNAWHVYIWSTVCAIGSGAVYPAYGIVIAIAVSSFQVNLDTQTGRSHLRTQSYHNAIWFFLIAVGSMVIVCLQTYLFNYAATLLVAKIRGMSFRAILRQDVKYFDDDKHSTGALTSNLSDNAQRVKGLGGSTLGAIVQSFACLAIGMAVGLAYGAKLAAVAIATVPFVLSTGYISLRVVMLKDQKNKAAHDESAQLACEAAASIRTVAALTREDDCVRIYRNSLTEPLQRTIRADIWSTTLFALSTSFIFWSISLVSWYGSRLVANGSYDTTQVFVCLMSITFGATQVGNAFTWVPDVSSAIEAAGSIVKLLDARPIVDVDSTDGTIPRNVAGEVRLESVHFRYPTRQSVSVLRGFDITVVPGTYVALVGASGCGKSTVIQLIERFYDPDEGVIYLDGVPISRINVREYRKHVSLVSQEPTLYSGSIRFNILLGAVKPITEVTQEEIDLACQDANILDFIHSLPEGFETEVGNKGAQLSGGQKQRIAIARALLRNPKVLLLDEATSALDSQSERVVQEALDRAAKGRTTIAVAHRLSTIQNADQIYFLQDGVVAECGTHEQLIQTRGRYFEFTQLQQVSLEASGQ